jgi:hypothetical protein
MKLFLKKKMTGDAKMDKQQAELIQIVNDNF